MVDLGSTGGIKRGFVIILKGRGGSEWLVVLCASLSSCRDSFMLSSCPTLVERGNDDLGLF